MKIMKARNSDSNWKYFSLRENNKKPRHRSVRLQTSNFDSGKALCGLLVILIAGGGVFLTYWGIYDSFNQDVHDQGSATRLYSDYWGRWVELDGDASRVYRVDNDAWTTIRIGDNVVIFRTFVTWEIAFAHRISIS